MPFSQPCTWRAQLTLMLKLYVKTAQVFLEICLFLQTIICRGQTSISDRSPEKIRQFMRIFAFKVGKKLGIEVFIEALLSWEQSCGHVKCSFQNHAKVLWRKSENLSLKLRNQKTLFFPDFINSPKNTFGELNCIFDTTA